MENPEHAHDYAGKLNLCRSANNDCLVSGIGHTLAGGLFEAVFGQHRLAAA